LGFFNIKDLIEDVYKYIDVRLELAKLDTEERLTRAGVLIFQMMVIASMLGVSILFLNLGLAYFLNTLPFFDKRPYLGFLCIAALQFALIGILGLSRSLISQRTKRMIRKTLNKYVKYILTREDSK
jgi:Putative Actinobacterial Holin-X, holin superfamily III